MAKSNETVAEIVREMCEMPQEWIVDANANFVFIRYAARIEAAHNREIAAKDDERLTIVANYETIITAKDAEIADLRECLKPILSVRLCDGGTQPISDALCAVAECKSKWRKALGGDK